MIKIGFSVLVIAVGILLAELANRFIFKIENHVGLIHYGILCGLLIIVVLGELE